ncbi:DNA-methyltransferase [Agromyces seonyuensis]|uniref:Methyltransferase n=1 Tax=Agromyces seonyuensis TaxID=2662446 RepID=A0A6I4P0Q5_9MICO|nr:site-specific DNA-methyltransferase [Agromyces seonyuensis]MWB98315.1 site-specific DNA-methyltransferase [Agromyces seonyuensis]
MELTDLMRHLGTPAYERDGVVLFRGDCVDGMRSLPEGWADLVVTSPPYNIGKEYEQRLDLGQYLDWTEQWIGAAHRASTANGQFWLNLGYLEVKGRGRAVPIPYLMWDRTPFYLRQEVVWSYGAGTTSSRAFAPRNEKVLWYVKDPDAYYFDLDSVRDPDVKYPNQKKNGKLKVNPLGKNPGDVWYIPKVTSGYRRSSKERTPHPAQFPEALIERIILACTRPGDIVLDPFMGSGTTAAVAARLGRRCVGFELRDDYLRVAVSRIEGLLDMRASQLSIVENDGELRPIDNAG